MGAGRRRGPGQGDEGIGADIVGHAVGLAAGVDETPRQLVLVGKGDGVDQEIHRAPTLFQRAKACSKAVIIGHVDVDQKIAADTGRQRFHAFAKCVALIGKCQFSALIGQRLETACIVQTGHRIVNGAGADHDEGARILVFKDVYQLGATIEFRKMEPGVPVEINGLRVTAKLQLHAGATVRVKPKRVRVFLDEAV